MAKNKGGRPTVMTPEVVGKLEHAFSIGCTDVEACLYADISRQALYDYEKKHPEFTDRKHELKEKPVLQARSNIVDALKKKDKDMTKWYMERKRKAEFSTRQEHTGKDGDAIELKISDILGDLDGGSTGLPGTEE